MSSWDSKYISNLVPPILYHGITPKKFEPIKTADNKYKIETDYQYIDFYSMEA